MKFHKDLPDTSKKYNSIFGRLEWRMSHFRMDVGTYIPWFESVFPY